MPVDKSLSHRHLPPDAKRQVIFEAARQVISERGFDGAKMEEIAARAGVGKGTLYNFFPSKEELLLSLVTENFERIRDLVNAETEAAGDPWATLEAGWRTLLLRVFPELASQWNFSYQLWSFLARNADARTRLFAQWRTMYTERERQIVAAIRAGQASGDFRSDVAPERLVPLLLAIFDGVLNRSIVDPDRFIPEVTLESVLDLIRRVLAPPATPH